MLKKTRNTTDTGQSTAAPIGETSANVSRPEFFRLPSIGGDRFFGLTRSFYYEGENRGYWRLVRLRQRGKQRGVTLIPFDAVAKFVRNQMLVEGSPTKAGNRRQEKTPVLASKPGKRFRRKNRHSEEEQTQTKTSHEIIQGI